MESKTLYRGKFLEFVATGHWEFVRRARGAGDSVGILAVTEDRRVILIAQFRVPVGRRCVEIPAGLVGDSDGSEDWKVAALRELREETGYAADDMVMMTAGPSCAGLTSECIRLVRAVGVRKVGEPEPDGDEKIEVFEVALEEVDGFLKGREAKGELVDSKV